jgi:hypothetical protein
LQGDPDILGSFLRDHPQESVHVQRAALNQFNKSAFPSSLAIALGLVSAGSADAVPVLEKLIEYDRKVLRVQHHSLWRYLSGKDSRSLRYYLIDHAKQWADDLLANLSAEQALETLLPVDAREFITDLHLYLDSGHPIERVEKLLVSYLECLVFSGDERQRSSEGVGIRNCIASVDMLWESGKAAQALAVLSALSITEPACFPSRFLPLVAEQLHSLQEIDLLRAANLLRRFPRTTWIVPLKQVWIKMHKSLARSGTRFEGAESPDAMARSTYAAAGAIAMALGICTACDTQPRSSDVSAHGFKELDNLINKRNAAAEEHEKLIRAYYSHEHNKREAEKRIIELKDKIQTQDAFIRHRELEILDGLSVADLLLLVLADDQSFSPVLRQDVAWALWKLWELGHLDEADRQKVLQAVRHAVSGTDLSELESAINNIVTRDDVRPSVLSSCAEYFYNRDSKRLIAALGSIDLTKQERESIFTKVKALVYGLPSHHFTERIVQHVAGQTLLELECTIVDGLNWVSDLIEGSRPESDSTQVRHLVQLLYELMPNAVDFLIRYPLRLMTMEQHRQILGQYTKTKARISLWTRYEPPQWRPEMPKGNAGKVISRYIQIEDRSMPNAMGIAHRLFAHPLLALPVIYHEFMHYGGPKGDPDLGIDNETEVLLREIIFARGLIARMAPSADADIPRYEQEVVQMIKSTEMWGLGTQLRYDLEDDAVVALITEEVLRTYGPQLTDDAAFSEADREIAFDNLTIERANNTDPGRLNWCSEVAWPYLGSAETQVLTTRYRMRLHDSLTTDHRIDISQRDRILTDPVCRQFSAMWEMYINRKDALRVFEREWPSNALYVVNNMPYIVSRFGGRRQW